MDVRRAGSRVFLLGLAACHGGGPGVVSPERLPAPKRTAACYALDYHRDNLAPRLPALIALDEGGGSGRAFWYPGPPGDTTWRAFYASGHWDRPSRGHVTVDFDAGEVRVGLDLEQREGTLHGRATRRVSEAEGKTDERSAALDGKHVNCPPPPAAARE